MLSGVSATITITISINVGPIEQFGSALKHVPRSAIASFLPSAFERRVAKWRSNCWASPPCPGRRCPNSPVCGVDEGNLLEAVLSTSHSCHARLLSRTLLGWLAPPKDSSDEEPMCYGINTVCNCSCDRKPGGAIRQRTPTCACRIQSWVFEHPVTT